MQASVEKSFPADKSQAKVSQVVNLAVSIVVWFFLIFCYTLGA